MKLIDLHEAAVADIPKYDHFQKEDLLDHIKAHCADFIPYLRRRMFLFRGEFDQNLSIATSSHMFSVVDTAKTERKSENTANYYTILLDTNPHTKDFPKRSRSFICTSDDLTANSFGSSTYCLIPYDTAKIASVHNDDIWNVKVNFLGTYRYLSSINASMDQFMSSDASLSSLEHLSRLIKSGDKDSIEWFNVEFPKASKSDRENFLGALYDALKPENTRFEWAYTKDFGKIYAHGFEYWVQGKVIMVDRGMISKVLSEI